MDAVAPTRAKINRFLPYWAVFQADLKQTLHSWIYRVWVLLSFGASVGYLLYRFGAKQESGIMQPAHETVGHLMHWVIYGSLTLIIVLTAGAICAERGTMADSVLSRGISRYQYFLGKLHARLLLQRLRACQPRPSPTTSPSSRRRSRSTTRSRSNTIPPCVV